MSYQLDSLHCNINIEVGNLMTVFNTMANVINFLSSLDWKADHMLKNPEDLTKETKKSQNTCLSQNRQNKEVQEGINLKLQIRWNIAGLTRAFSRYDLQSKLMRDPVIWRFAGSFAETSEYTKF